MDSGRVGTSKALSVASRCSRAVSMGPGEGAMTGSQGRNQMPAVAAMPSSCAHGAQEQHQKNAPQLRAPAPRGSAPMLCGERWTQADGEPNAQTQRRARTTGRAGLSQPGDRTDSPREEPDASTMAARGWR